MYKYGHVNKQTNKQTNKQVTSIHMSAIEEFLKRLETISELLVPDWRSNAAQNFPQFAPLLDTDKLLRMDARHELQELLRASRLSQSEQELIKFQKHKLHQNQALKKYRQKRSVSSISEEIEFKQLIRERDELVELRRQLIWEKNYFDTMCKQQQQQQQY